MERMEIEELKDYYKARVEPYGKSMNELLEEVAKETNAYKQLEEENKKLREELSKYKKQYQHSMGFMEEDTLQELRDIGEL